MNDRYTSLYALRPREVIILCTSAHHVPNGSIITGRPIKEAEPQRTSYSILYAEIMVVKGVLLCSLLLLVVSVLGLLAQAPGDADGACLVGGNTKSYPAGWRVLMDSRNYVDLLGGSQPAWRSRDLDGQGQGVGMLFNLWPICVPE